MRKGQQLLLSYYGDDFTGSTDVMEALACANVPTVLFLGIPTERLQARFADARALGIASTSRSQSTQWMERHLGPSFMWLKSLNAEICHYKTCSTFDSSPDIGNIGKAIEIGMATFRQKFVPIVVGVPQLGRYTAFGQLFAAYQGEVHRIDRHPVMSRHPVTPMAEADLRLHLARQSPLPTELIDLAALKRADYAALSHDRLSGHEGGVLIDVIDLETQRRAGEVVWQNKTPDGLFTVGSSGLEYALIAHWTAAGIIKPQAAFAPVAPAPRIAAVSGSLSPMTERQIARAAQDGFDIIAADAVKFAGDRGETEVNRAITLAEAVLRRGGSPLIHTQAGAKSTAQDGKTRLRQSIGAALGQILRRLVERNGLRRVVIAGGDTSGQVCEALEIDALTMRAPVAGSPGAPLCLAHGEGKASDGLEVALKGGQLGAENYFSQIRDGR
jgi:3-oxoisoapionate kinase